MGLKNQFNQGMLLADHVILTYYTSRKFGGLVVLGEIAKLKSAPTFIPRACMYGDTVPDQEG